MRQMLAKPSCITTAQTSAFFAVSNASRSIPSATLSHPSAFSSVKLRCSSRSNVWWPPSLTYLFSSATRPATCSCDAPGSKSTPVTRSVRLVCTLVDVVLPVRVSVVTRRIALARRTSFGRMRL